MRPLTPPSRPAPVSHPSVSLASPGSPEFARQCIDQSIENLGSAPDMWLLHRIDKKTPVEESVKAMEEARQAGKCKYIGLSAVRPAHLLVACYGF